MPEIIIKGEDIDEIEETVESLRTLEDNTEKELIETVRAVRKALRDAKVGDVQGSMQKSEIKSKSSVDSEYKVESALHILKAHGVVETKGKSWKYIGE